MTDRKQALQDLLAKVEAGELKPRDPRTVFETPMQDMQYTIRPRLAYEAYDGSLDAAKALHDAVASGWNFCVESNLDGYQVILEKPVNLKFIRGRSLDCPARAWLMALIEVLIAECDT